MEAEGERGGAGLTEDALAQLRAAQEEAAALKKQLAELQGQQTSSSKPDVVEAPKRRIDSTDKREMFFTAGSRPSWLSEADVDFFTGGGTGEGATAAPLDPAAQATVQRRLVIGGVAAAGLLAFSLVPTKDLQFKPSKPLYFYLVPLLRVQEQLVQCQQFIEDADWASLRLQLRRITGPPGDARGNLYAAVALLPAGAAATRAEELAGDVVEYLDSMDYNKYFDAMPTAAVSGAQNAEFVNFSAASCRSARARLSDFLAAMPRGDLEAARTQMEVEAGGVTQ